MSSIKLMLVDDHDIVRAGLRMLLDAQSDMEIVAEAGSGADAIILAQSHSPDIILMDVNMPDMNGIETTCRVKAVCPNTKILALTIHEEEEYFFKMLNAGASGYIPKRAAPEDLLTAIHAVYQGEVFLHPSVAGALVKDYLQRGETLPEPVTIDDPVLTDREQQVLTLIAEGLTNKQIGEQLGISPKTVARHRDNISQKLNLSTRAELTRYAIQIGLVSP